MPGADVHVPTQDVFLIHVVRWGQSWDPVRIEVGGLRAMSCNESSSQDGGRTMVG